jgi:hypothetical protein
MPTVVIIMPHLRLVSRNLVLYISVLMRRQPAFILALSLASCGVFAITHAAQFALQAIFTSPANRVF